MSKKVDSPVSSSQIFTDDIHIHAGWRPFQQRVLDLFDASVQAGNRRFHVVAAPGSGKTMVGLEMLRRLDAPALVLCPTLNIRDQWVAAFHPLLSILRVYPVRLGDHRSLLTAPVDRDNISGTPLRLHRRCVQRGGNN